METKNIIIEDEQLLVLDKPAGLVVNKSQTSQSTTLQDDLSTYFGLGQSDLGIGGRAGIVHRLDRETSGLMVIAKTEKAYSHLQEQFKKRLVKKEYVALVHGILKESKGEVNATIGRVGTFGKYGIVPGGREAQTQFEVVEQLKIKDEVFGQATGDMTKNKIRYLQKLGRDFTLLNLFPKTGRTHQIRVHLKSINHPIVSDKIYGPGRLLKFDLSWCPRLFLHARAITFTHPATGKQMFFQSDIPQDLKEALKNLSFN